MSVFLTADIQLHNHSSFGTLLPTGFSNRLQDGIIALRQVSDAAKAGDTIIILGDLFETQRAVDTSVMFAVSEWIDDVLKDGIKLVLVAGNHDHYSRSGSIHALRPFELLDGVTVVSEHAVLELDGDQYVLFAYTDDTEALKTRLKDAVSDLPERNVRGRFLCLHQGISGAALASSIFEGALGLDDLHQEYFDHIFLGHFHKPQSLNEKVTYLGSPYQVTSEEAGDVKRFIKVERGTIESIRTTGNCFHRISFDDLEQALVLKPGYYKVCCSTAHQADKVAGLARTLGIKAQALFERSSEVAEGPRASAAAMNWDDAVRDWLSGKGRPDLVNEALQRLNAASNQSL